MSAWIEWRGGVCPVPGWQTVHALFRDDMEDTGPADGWEWEHKGDGSDIVAYRVAEDER